MGIVKMAVVQGSSWGRESSSPAPGRERFRAVESEESWEEPQVLRDAGKLASICFDMLIGTSVSSFSKVSEI
jgi:hypothetical protein